MLCAYTEKYLFTVIVEVVSKYADFVKKSKQIMKCLVQRLDFFKKNKQINKQLVQRLGTPES